MRGHDIVGIDLFQFGDDSAYVIFRQRRNDMETADYRVHFLHPGCRCACLIVFSTPRWLHDVRITSPFPLTTKFVAISCSKSSGMKSPVFFAATTLSGKQPNPPVTPTFSLVGKSGFSELTCAIFPVVKA